MTNITTTPQRLEYFDSNSMTHEQFNRYLDANRFSFCHLTKERSTFHPVQAGIYKLNQKLGEYNIVSLLMNGNKYQDTDKICLNPNHKHLREVRKNKGIFATTIEVSDEWDIRYSGMDEDAANPKSPGVKLNEELFRNDNLFLVHVKNKSVWVTCGLYRLVKYEWCDMFRPCPWAFYLKKC